MKTPALGWQLLLAFALSLLVLQFHMLPNPIPTDQFVNGYSFNTVNS